MDDAPASPARARALNEQLADARDEVGHLRASLRAASAAQHSAWQLQDELADTTAQLTELRLRSEALEEALVVSQRQNRRLRQRVRNSVLRPDPTTPGWELPHTPPPRRGVEPEDDDDDILADVDVDGEDSDIVDGADFGAASESATFLIHNGSSEDQVASMLGLRAQIAELHGELEGTTRRHAIAQDKAEAALTALRRENDHLQARLRSMSAQVEAMEQAEHDMQAQAERVQAALAKLQAVESEWEQRVQSAEAERDELKSHVAHLQAEAAAATLQATATRDEMSRMQSLLDASSGRVALLDQAESELATLRQQHAALELERDSLAEGRDALQALVRASAPAGPQRLDLTVGGSAQQIFEGLVAAAASRVADAVEKESTRLRELEDALSDAQRSFAEECERSRTLAAQVEDLRHGLETAADRLTSAELAAQQRERERRALVDSVELFRATASQASAERDHVRQELEELRAALTDKTQIADAASNPTVALLAAALRASEDARTALEARAGLSAHDVLSLGTSDALQESVSAIERLERDKRMLLDSAKAQARRVAALEAEIQSLRASASASSSPAPRPSPRASLISSSGRPSPPASSRRGSPPSLASRVMNRPARPPAPQPRLEELETRCSTLETENSELRQQIGQLEARLQESRADAAVAEETMRMTASRLQDGNRLIGDLQARLALSLESEKKARAAVAVRAAPRVRGPAVNVVTLTIAPSHELEELRVELDDAHADADALISRVEQLTSERDSATAIVASQRNSLERLESKHASLQDVVNSLVRQLRARLLQVKAQAGAEDALRAALHDHELRASRLEEELQTLKHHDDTTLASRLSIMLRDLADAKGTLQQSFEAAMASQRHDLQAQHDTELTNAVAYAQTLELDLQDRDHEILELRRQLELLEAQTKVLIDAAEIAARSIAHPAPDVRHGASAAEFVGLDHDAGLNQSDQSSPGEPSLWQQQARRSRAALELSVVRQREAHQEAASLRVALERISESFGEALRIESALH